MTLTSASLLGLAMGNARANKDFERERAILQIRFDQVKLDAACAQAQNEAAKAVLKAIVGELVRVDAAFGKPGPAPDIKGFCLPKNTALRADAFIETACGQLRRTSNGKLRFMDKRVLRYKTSPKEISAYSLLKSSDLQR